MPADRRVVPRTPRARGRRRHGEPAARPGLPGARGARGRRGRRPGARSASSSARRPSPRRVRCSRSCWRSPRENGVTGTVSSAPRRADAADDGEPAEPVEEPLPPHHQEAYDAIARRRLRRRRSPSTGRPSPRTRATPSRSPGSPRSRCCSASTAPTSPRCARPRPNAPTDVDAQLAVADLDMSGGHLDDAFGRLLDLFPTLDAARQGRRPRPPARVLRDRRRRGPARHRGPPHPDQPALLTANRRSSSYDVGTPARGYAPTSKPSRLILG